MGDNDLMEKILLQVQDDLQLIKVGQVEMRNDIAAIKTELDELQCDDEGRDLLGVIRVIQTYPKAIGAVAIVTLLGTISIGSVALSRFGLDVLMDEVEARYMTGPGTPVMGPKPYNQPISPEEMLYENQ